MLHLYARIKGKKVVELAKYKHEKESTPIYKTLLFKTALKIVVASVLIISLFANLFTHVTPVVKYYGESMSPTLENGQILVVNKLAKIKNGDIIAFYYNNKVLVRRVVALGSEQVEIDAFGTVSVNGEKIDEPYVKDKTLGQCNISFPYNVPSNTYFALGDNRAVAMDSRLAEIGTVDKDRLIGKVVFSLKPMKSVK